MGVNKKGKNDTDLGFLPFFVRSNQWNQTGDENEKGAPALIVFFGVFFFDLFSV